MSDSVVSAWSDVESDAFFFFDTGGKIVIYLCLVSDTVSVSVSPGVFFVCARRRNIGIC